jgi:hypothetical protein
VIFTSLGLLLVALGFLIAGIAKSSVALLMVSLFVTLFAGITLVLVATAARRIVEAQTALAATPGAPSSIDLTAYSPAGGNGGAPIVGYEVMTVEQVVKLIRSGALSDEQLEAVHTYELDHQARKTVLDRLERVLA